METLTIPIKPHLRKYLLKEFETKKNTILVTTKNNIGLMLFKMLSHTKNYTYNRIYDFSKYVKINVELNKRIVVRKIGDSLRSEDIYFFNKMLQELFLRDLHKYIETRVELCNEFSSAVECEIKQFRKIQKITNRKGEMFLAISHFLSKYNIYENELEFETLVKSYYRYRMGLLLSC